MSNYKITYFNGRGRAEITRLIFAAAGEKYTDERFEFEEWPSKKADSPLGQLPYLTIDGFKLPQSHSIARLIAKRFNLYGSDDLEQAKTDAVVDTVTDLVVAYWDRVYEVRNDVEKKAEAEKKFLNEEINGHLEKIEKLISLWGSNGFSVGSSLKWSDLAIFEMTFNVGRSYVGLIEKYPAISGVKKSVETHPKLSEYIKSRPETRF